MTNNIEVMCWRVSRGIPLSGIRRTMITLAMLKTLNHGRLRSMNLDPCRVLHSMWIQGNFTLYCDNLVSNIVSISVKVEQRFPEKKFDTMIGLIMRIVYTVFRYIPNVYK